MYGLDPGIAAYQAAQQAKIDGDETSEQIDRATMAAVCRVDNVGLTASATAFGTALGGPAAGALLGLGTGYLYGESSQDGVTDSAIANHSDPEAMENLHNNNLSP